MAIYLINFCLIALYSFFIKNKKLLIGLAGAQMFLLLALRSMEVGWIDIRVYVKGYDFIAKLSFSDLLSRLSIISIADLRWPYAFESGYTLLNWIFGAMGIPFEAFLLFYAVFCVTTICWFIYDNSEDVGLSLLLFMAWGTYTFSFFILRQTLAMCVGLIAYQLLKKKKIAPYLILCFVAFWLHRASVVMMVVLLFREKKFTRTKAVRYMLIFMACLVLAPYAYSIVITPVLAILGKSTYSSLNFTYNNLIMLMFLIFICIIFLARFKSSAFLRKNPMLAYGFIAVIPLEILGMCNDGFARSVHYLLIFSTILIPNLLKEQAHKEHLIFYRLAIATVAFAYYWYTLGASIILPYVFFWQ